MYIIGITGGTASGKTTFIKALKQKCPKELVAFISQDNYYCDTSLLSIKQREAINFDHPEAIDFTLLIEHIQLLKNNVVIHQPTYSFQTHNRTTITEKITPKKVLILEGILILSNPKLKALCDTCVFIDAPETVRIQRRIIRDVAERGRTKESILRIFKDNISPMHRKFIAPLKNSVDYVLDGTKDFTDPVEKMLHLILSKK